MKRGIWTVAFVCAPMWAWAQDVVQSVAHGQVNWSAKTVTATGSGAPSLKAANAAAARLGAERAAKLDAYRNVLEAVRGVRVSGGQDAGAAMDQNPAVKAKIEGLVQGFKIIDTKYYSDGGVDIILQGPLDGVVTESLVTGAGAKAAKAGPASDGTTGVVINAKGLGAAPALAMRLLDEAGSEVYGVAWVGADALRKGGIASYVSGVDKAQKDPRVAGKPLTIKALRLASAGGSDLVVANADADKLRQLGSVLADGKVVVVTE